MFKKLKPHPDGSIPFLVLISFLTWLVLARLWTYFLPNSVITIKGIHVHHYAYGIVLLSLLAFVFLTFRLTHAWRLRFAPLLGLALASAYDEFAMWLLLEDAHKSPTNLDAVMVVTLILLNAVYFQPFWKKWGTRLGHLISILLFGLPRKILKTLRKRPAVRNRP